ncbi:MAG: glycosyl transferase group 1 [Candidatus Magnetoglobus multicellularis str. Araruama]|uniref:Glycosyl transferase group 1 n=1 Tax=Candidatus Magnetoglobus multicellularis str. Araruama TaxID=890399 RepID=A0A1V1PAT8_9BACT|nr:MAG: glycosyl transferase group 1 [Candidatus Magnetoglobus multicellularis str. Araruama]
MKNKRYRICFLSYRSNPHCGGQGVYIKHLTRALNDLGHRVDVISGPPYPELSQNIRLIKLKSLDLYNPSDLFRTPQPQELQSCINLYEWLSVCSMGFPEPTSFGFRAYHYLRKRIHQYDIVHDNQCLSYGIYGISRLKPLVATIHHPMTVDRRIAIQTAPNFLRKLQAIRWYSFIGMQIRVARKLKQIITVSQCAAADIHQEFGIPRKQFSVVPNGIDIHSFKPIPGIQRDPCRILTTNSADMPLKGLKYLLDAVDELRLKYPIHLYVVGSPKPDGIIEEHIRQKQLQSNVHFLGRIDQHTYNIQYAKAGMAVIPSLYEGFGLPAGEAMACAVPLISTRGGALPEVVGNAGILVEPGNTKKLVSKIQYLIDHPVAAEKLGQSGYKRVHQEFTWNKAAEKVIDVYSRLNRVRP